MKPNYSLIPPSVLEDIAIVFTYGGKKHGDFEWVGKTELLPNHIERSLRHIQEWRLGRTYDEETLVSPLVHAICRLIMVASIENDETEWKDGPQRSTGSSKGISQTTKVSEYIQKEIETWKKTTGRND